MDTQKRLNEALAKLAAEYAESAPPAEVERAVLAEFDRVTRTRQRGEWMWAAAGIAAAAILAVWTLRMQPPPAVDVAPKQVANRVAGEEQQFIPIPYVTPLAAYEQVEVVRMDMPVAALIAAGLPLQADPGGRVSADVMVGQDGRARAVRLISVSNLN